MSRQLVTYIGNKRALLNFIGQGIEKILRRLNRKKIRAFDVFSGSGIVARYLKQFSKLLITNDLEKYSAVINECYLSNESGLDIPALRNCHEELIRQCAEKPVRGIIAEYYAPKDDNRIARNDRVFYTTRNAMYIDTMRRLIERVPLAEQKFFLAPLLAEASVHANTSGVFKGFYKNRETGIGHFGGKNQNALSRIKGEISLPFPVFSNYDCEILVCRGDSNEIIKTVPEVDIAYLDPPYNQHPYGSNYFMLNLIVDYKKPENISKVSGIPADWKRSGYNREKTAFDALTALVCGVKSKYVLVSFNSEGFIHAAQMTEMLRKIGKTEVLETSYNTFRGSRNLSGRNLRVTEYLFVLEK